MTWTLNVVIFLWRLDERRDESNEVLQGLMHHCIGAGCEFCEWRKKNPIHLGWEYLLPDSPASATSAESARLHTYRQRVGIRNDASQDTSGVETGPGK